MIFYVFIFINLQLETGYTFSRKLVSLFLCVLDLNFQTLPNDFSFLQLVCCGDIKRSPGPAKSTGISFCHWNLCSISAHEISLLKAMVTCKQYDSCLSESLILIFDSSLKSADKKSSIERYDLIRLSSKQKRRGLYLLQRSFTSYQRR